MKNEKYTDVVTRVLKASGAWGAKKRDLRQELENHIWEAIRVLQEQGIEEAEIPNIILERFGPPEIIGQQLSLMHGFFKKILTFLVPALGAVVVVAILLPGDVEHAARRYQRYIGETYLDNGWYARAENIAGRAEQETCTYAVDGIGVSYVPAGNIITTCYSKWLMVKFLPPIQLAGPEIKPFDVLHVMKMEGGLRSVDAADGEDGLEEFAEFALEEYLHALAVGAGNAPTEDIIAMNFDEPFEMGEAVDREYEFQVAASYWDGDLSQLADWNPGVDSANEAELFKAACANQLLCYPLEKATVQSVSRWENESVVVFDVQLQGEGDVSVSPFEFQFQVTRFEDGYPNDTDDDIYRVTSGHAYLP